VVDDREDSSRSGAHFVDADAVGACAACIRRDGSVGKELRDGGDQFLSEHGLVLLVAARHQVVEFTIDKKDVPIADLRALHAQSLGQPGPRAVRFTRRAGW